MVFSTHISISFLCAVISLHLGVNFKVKRIQAQKYKKLDMLIGHIKPDVENSWLRFCSRLVAHHAA
ncbi:hypothetical protein FYF76_10850 [Vibrio cholerae]|nr:hypothetical protein [Vibrio cholerae]